MAVSRLAQQAGGVERPRESVLIAACQCTRSPRGNAIGPTGWQGATRLTGAADRLTGPVTRTRLRLPQIVPVTDTIPGG
jgi:hypothetical protein